MVILGGWVFLMSEVPLCHSPLSSEFGINKTVKARFWPWLEPFSGKSLGGIPFSQDTFGGIPFSQGSGPPRSIWARQFGELGLFSVPKLTELYPLS